ncbi:MAG: acetyl-CoA carboxylase, biotin carboxyl carrier protein [Thermomicrobiales bacterium]|nr:acetyl-CoA carboxylase, biotin carboxyl carrier protein [Thermomicrobiales bacterium]
MTQHEQSAPRLSEVAEIVRSLVETMRANGLTKLDVEVGDVKIELRAGGSREVVAESQPAVDRHLPAIPLPAPSDTGHLVRAPMIGTFYTSAAPGEPPFVRLGDRVEPGQVIGIIEAMKIMNEIVSDRGGVVTELIAGNAQPVEYGSPLVRLMLDESSE